MDISVLLAFCAMIGWGVGDFLIQKTVKKIGAVGTLFWITFFSSFALLPWAIKSLIGLSTGQILLLLGMGAIGFLSGMVHLSAMKIGKLAVVETILCIELPLTILLGVIFFAETLSNAQLLMIFSLFVGIVLVSINFRNIHRKDFLERGSLLALASAFIVALVNFLTAKAAKDISPFMALWLPWLISGFICLVYIKRQGAGHLWQKSRLNWKLITVMVIFDTIAWLSYAAAVAKKELSITIAITEGFVVVALLLGVIINKEKIAKLQYIGAGLTIACSLLIGLTS